MSGLVFDLGINKPSKRTIMVADDELNIQSALFHAWEDVFNLVTAHYTNEVLERAENQQPEIILLNPNMPGTTGYELVHALRYGPKTKHIPVIIITTEEDMKKSKILFEHDSNVKGFYAKPFSGDALKKYIESLLP